MKEKNWRIQMDKKIINFVLFGDFSNLQADPDIVMNMYQKLTENNMSFLPGTFQEINVDIVNGTGKGIQKFNRPNFTNSKEKLSVQIATDNIKIIKELIDIKKYNFFSELDEFKSQIKKIIKSLYNIDFEISKGTRTSFIVQNFKDEKEIDFNLVYNNLYSKNSDYNPENFLEWNSRKVIRDKVTINNLAEEINYVNEIGRIQGIFDNSKPEDLIDTIVTIFDSNTLLSKNEVRVDENFIIEFLEITIEKFKKCYSENEVLIFGEE